MRFFLMAFLIFAIPAHAEWALLDQNNVVQNVILADIGFVAQQPGTWIQTDAAGKFTKNLASRGATYDPGRNAFIPKQDAPSWTLNEKTLMWDPPVPRPTDGNPYLWDEPTLSWVAPAVWKANRDAEKALADKAASDAKAAKDASDAAAKAANDALKAKVKSKTATPADVRDTVGYLLQKLGE